MRVPLAFQKKALLSALGGIPPYACDRFLNDGVEGLVFVDNLPEVTQPLCPIDVFVRSTLQKSLVEPIDHSFSVKRVV